MTKENNETVAYQSLMNDNVKDLVPQFYREVEYNGDCILVTQESLGLVTSWNLNQKEKNRQGMGLNKSDIRC